MFTARKLDAYREHMVNSGTFREHYGCLVSDMGEDGEVLILGHAPDRRAIAAANRHARKVWGLANFYDAPGVLLAGGFLSVRREWAVPAHAGNCVHYDDGDPIRDDQLCQCAELPITDGWWLTWHGVDENTPHAFAVTAVIP